MIKLKDIIKEGVIKPLLESAYDDDADKQGRDDGTSWMANSSAGDYGAKYKGQIRYFDDEDSAKAYAKSGSKDSKGGGDDDKKDKEDPGKLSGSDFDRQADKEEPKGVSNAEAILDKVPNTYKEAQQIKGEGDAKASRIYADAFSKNKEFYDFYRSLEAYKKSFSSKDDVMVLDADSDFFKYLKSPNKK